MNCTIKKFIYGILLICYTAGTTVSTVLALEGLLNFSSERCVLAAGNKSHPASGLPVLTVKTHFFLAPHSEFSIHINTAAGSVHFNTNPRTHDFVNFQSRYTHLECLPSKPRDPPLV